jgi:predicted CoA-substrate-specific enzyme activase
MLTAGCDVGSRTAKAVILENNTILTDAVISARLDPIDSARSVMNMALEQAGLALDAIDTIVGTGYGQQQIPFAHTCRSEIVCHARGAFWNVPTARTIVDIGGQDSKAIRLDQDGRVIRYSYNDKCAAGTGRFLEIMADALQVELEEMGACGKTYKEEISISNQCVIFAETEVVSLINEEKDVADILNALHCSLGKRVAAQVRSLLIEEDVIMTGGVAKNSGVFDALAQGLGVGLKQLEGVDPQIIGALGAALIAADGNTA